VTVELVSEAEAVKVAVPLKVLPLVGAVSDMVGPDAAAWLTVKVWPAMVIVPVRALVVLLGATE
jgi:hypothetical protein